jgi:hypothetical protein
MIILLGGITPPRRLGQGLPVVNRGLCASASRKMHRGMVSFRIPYGGSGHGNLVPSCSFILRAVWIKSKRAGGHPVHHRSEYAIANVAHLEKGEHLYLAREFHRRHATSADTARRVILSIELVKLIGQVMLTRENSHDQKSRG